MNTQALNNYIIQLANQGTRALEINPALAKGLNVQDHCLVHPAVRSVFPDLVS